MNLDRCLITLKPLKGKKELAEGYTKKGVKYLTGSTTTDTTLPFTRRGFIEVGPINQKGMSISGYQPKLSLCIINDQFNVVKNSATYILKPSPEQFPMLAENEHAIMLVMQQLGFDVPPFGLVAFSKEKDEDSVEYAFIIKRYDRVNELEKVHQEQLDAAMNVADKYGKVDGVAKVSYEQACKFLINNINSSLKFKQDIFLRIIYAYVLGNNDLHLRNFGILVPKVEPESLAPVYDYVSTIPYFEGDPLALPLLALEENETDLAPGFNTEHGTYIGYDFILFAKAIGINEKMALKLLHRVTTKSASIILDTINASYMKNEHKVKVLSCVNIRLKAIKETEYQPL
ncbi:putative kinase [Psychromonas marina]|uniref:Kinase n=1 Tax=Psychromonas marina TaxID=88364 RepID=A0ABQ6DVI4_9GAMM|nr:HipA domain-containing protein [Psychromonas marina]GLS88995.1 putative kinase [Psychromonas marina]